MSKLFDFMNNSKPSKAENLPSLVVMLVESYDINLVLNIIHGMPKDVNQGTFKPNSDLPLLVSDFVAPELYADGPHYIASMKVHYGKKVQEIIIKVVSQRFFTGNTAQNKTNFDGLFYGEYSSKSFVLYGNYGNQQMQNIGIAIGHMDYIQKHKVSVQFGILADETALGVQVHLSNLSAYSIAQQEKYIQLEIERFFSLRKDFYSLAKSIENTRGFEVSVTLQYPHFFNTRNGISLFYSSQNANNQPIHTDVGFIDDLSIDEITALNHINYYSCFDILSTVNTVFSSNRVLNISNIKSKKAA